VVGLDRNFGLHRLRRHRASLGRRTAIRDTDSDLVRDYGMMRPVIRDLSFF